jgi:hypothetical protein
MLCALIYIKVKNDIKIDVCLFNKLCWLKTPLCLFYIDMHEVDIELSDADCVLVPVDAGFLVEVIRLWL